MPINCSMGHFQVLVSLLTTARVLTHCMANALPLDGAASFVGGDKLDQRVVGNGGDYHWIQG